MPGLGSRDDSGREATALGTHCPIAESPPAFQQNLGGAVGLSVAPIDAVGLAVDDTRGGLP